MSRFLTFRIEVPPALKSALRGLTPEALDGAITRGMKHGSELMVAHINRARMSRRASPGEKNPSTLGVVTGTGRRSVRATDPVSDGGEIKAFIGSNIGYIKAHEFGFSGTVKVKAHTRSVEKKSFRVRAHSREVRIPERRMIRGGGEESRHEVTTSIIAETRALMGKRNG